MFVRTGVLPDSAEGIAERVVERVSAQTNRRQLADAIAALNPGDRDVLLLAEAQGTELREARIRVPSRRRPFSRFGVRAAVAGGLAVALATGVVVVQVVNGRGGGLPVLPTAPPANAADVFNRAATVAAAEPGLHPRQDQYVYLETRGLEMTGTDRGGAGCVVHPHEDAADGPGPASSPPGSLDFGTYAPDLTPQDPGEPRH